MKLTPLVQGNELKPREGALPPELREQEKLIDAFAQEFSFARNEVERLQKSMARVINAWRLAEARHRQEHHQTRARLNTLFNGRIERWIYASDDEDMKSFFRRVWRDDLNPPRSGKAKDSSEPSVSPTAVKNSLRELQAREKTVAANARMPETVSKERSVRLDDAKTKEPV